MKLYEIETYTTSSGKAPFETWARSLKDSKAKLAIFARVERAVYGDFGDWKTITGAKGIFEMRIHYAQGYRVFYTMVGQKLILCWPVRPSRRRIEPSRKQNSISTTTTGDRNNVLSQQAS